MLIKLIKPSNGKWHMDNLSKRPIKEITHGKSNPNRAWKEERERKKATASQPFPA